MTEDSIAQVTAAILTGGQGRRMGGVDKGLVELSGKPLIEHVLSCLEPQAARLMINANRNRERYERYGYPVVGDRLDGFQGPLAGFSALLEACKDDWLVIAPCDTPNLPTDYVQRLLDTQTATGAEIVYAHDGEWAQPVHVMLPRHLQADLERFLASGERKIDRWYAEHHAEAADFSDIPQCFINLNQPKDYQRLGEAGP